LRELRKPLRVIGLRRQLAAFHAGVAAEQRIGRIAAYGDGAAILDVHFDCAVRVTEAAEGLLRLHGGARDRDGAGLSGNRAGAAIVLIRWPRGHRRATVKKGC
jgi:hypothetical protein